SNGKVLIAGSVDVQGGNIYFILDPASNSISPLDVPGFNPLLTGTLYRSADHSRVLLTGALTAGGVPAAAWYDASTGNISVAIGYPTGGLAAIALNPDGSQIAAYDGDHTVTIYDSNFNPLGTVIV